MNRVRLQLGDEACYLLQGRVRIIKQVYDALIRHTPRVCGEASPDTQFDSAWRPLVHSVHEWPLALCDSSSMPQEDLVEYDHVRRRFKGSAYHAYFNPEHRWYYLGNQTPDEVTFLKIFDSNSSVKATSTY